MSYWIGVVREEMTLGSYYFTIHTPEGQLIMESDSYKDRAKSVPIDFKVIDFLYSLDANKRESDRTGFRQWENEEFWFNKNNGIKNNFFAKLMGFDK
ncbi:MAG TPA: hypothetical protein PLH43_01310 [Acetivibrio sp.]|uniref:hypothetical protein n=1 Tax=Acetivibrio sp. TaxID=1872092 RepID=UPI002B88B35C|nr:hypothetical protein [Acetivibrio sp.]HOM01452.1 hypothetical protein [Acetivibrio sp.]